jgi:hypothetical protein
MARTVQVTKKSVVKTGGNRYNITLTLKYLDNGTVLFEQDFPQEYLTGESPAIYVALWDRGMQAAINDYKAQEGIFNASLLNTAVTTIQNGLEV